MKKIFVLTLLLSLMLFAGLTQSELKELKFRIAVLESRGLGDTLAENSYGYLGRYQFGVTALIDVGLIKRKNYEQATHIDLKTKKRIWNQGMTHKDFLNQAANWKLSQGKQSFLGNEILQENAMDTLLKANYARLKKTGVKIYRKDKMMGFLMAAHLGGFGSALRYLKDGTEYIDAYGTKISTYFSAAKQSIGNVRKQQEKIVTLGKKYLGGKYVWGGTNPTGFDCSGYVKYIYGKQGIKLPRTANAQSKVGKEVASNRLKKGDLLFFNTDKSRGLPVTHVGVYLEDGKFIHAANQREGIVISTLKSYQKRFVIAKRVIPEYGIAPHDTANTMQYSKVIPDTFFRSHLEQAIHAPTKVTLNTSTYRYQYVKGKYVQVGGVADMPQVVKEEAQLW